MQAGRAAGCGCSALRSFCFSHRNPTLERGGQISHGTVKQGSSIGTDGDDKEMMSNSSKLKGLPLFGMDRDGFLSLSFRNFGEVFAPTLRLPAMYL